jgi:hypothetical protein
VIVVRLFHCGQCGNRVFFDNVQCETCDSRLGFVPPEQAMVAFAVDDAGTWTRRGAPGPAMRPCSNYTVEGVCNWMVAADEPATQCISCRTTEVIPALGKPENHRYWSLLEQAKRRLFYTLIDLKLPAPDRAQDAVNGLSFRFMEDTSPKERVLTGHDDGLITLNIAEADDASREAMRTAMREPYRTLLGHFRHESGHYYWDRLVRDTAWIDEYRQTFGDERADYGDALNQHYSHPSAHWQLNFISSYASSHPWEDWAECWAHYLHMVDGLETAAAWGLRLDQAVPGGDALQVRPLAKDAPDVVESLIQQWLPVSQFSNAMSRSLGLKDSYPFVVPAPVVGKLNFVHRVVSAAARGEMPMNFSKPSAMAPVAAAVSTSPAGSASEAASQA